MAPPRKTDIDLANDPERENKTVNRPVVAPEDPERAQKTQAKFKRPGTRRPAPEADPLPEHTIDEEYRTGSNYGVSSSGENPAEEGIAGSMNLEGDGLNALDPEVGSKTRVLPLEELEGRPDDADDGEAARADDANATNAGNPMRLEIVAGPDKGTRRKLSGVRMVIGRTPGVDFLLTDQSVSRRHVELVQNDKGVLMRDLGSGNGTKINGARVAEKVLEHGDEIAIGKTVLRFVDEVAAFTRAREAAEKKEAEEKAAAEAAAAAPRRGNTSVIPKVKVAAEAEAPDEVEHTNPDGPRPDRSRPVRTGRNDPRPTGFRALDPKVRFGLLGFAALVVLILIIGVATLPPPTPPVEPGRVLADQKMQDARNLVKQGNYEAALKSIEEAEHLVAGIDRTKLGNQVKEEIAFGRGLDQARQAMADKKFGEARALLEKLNKGSLKSEEAKTRLRLELDAAEVGFKKEQIDDLLAAGDAEGARALVKELPSDQAAESAAKIADYEKQLEDQSHQDAVAQARANANAAAARKARREEEIAEAFATVERKFAGSEWDRAASECNRVTDAYGSDAEIVKRARSLQTQIPVFGRAFDEGLKKHRAGSLAQASKPLRQAWQLYGQLGLKQNKFGAELESKLGESSLAAGKDALLHDDLIGAYTNFRDAAKFDPGDSKARAGLLQVETKAEELFQFAYMQKDRDPKDALQKFKIVVQVTDPSTSIHEKAKNHIAALQP